METAAARADDLHEITWEMVEAGAQVLEGRGLVSPLTRTREIAKETFLAMLTVYRSAQSAGVVGEVARSAKADVDGDPTGGLPLIDVSDGMIEAGILELYDVSVLGDWRPALAAIYRAMEYERLAQSK